MAKLLYAARARIDIDLALSFLCSRVASPTRGDEVKPKSVLEYLKGCPDLPRFIGMDG